MTHARAFLPLNISAVGSVLNSEVMPMDFYMTLIIPGLVIIILANTVTALSAISMSAIATNGQIAGGGVYYMISRALGPALGGSIGLMFTMANIISVATYTIGFSESLLDLLADVIPTWDGMYNLTKSILWSKIRSLF